VYVTAFLEANLMGKTEYLPIFRDNRVIGDWLPKTMYITELETSSFRPLATFEEDIDVTSGTADGVGIRGDSLASWKEDVLPFRYRTSPSPTYTQENQAVWIGWNNRIAGRDTTRLGPPARYVLSLPEELATEWNLGPESTLDFMLTARDRTPGPRKDPEAEKKEDRGEESGEARGQSSGGGGGGWSLPNPFSWLFSGDEDELEEEKEPLRLSVQVVDARGRTAKVLLNRYGPVRRPIKIRIARRDDQQYRGDSEMVLQSYSIPLGDFEVASDDGLDLTRLTEVRFLFDESVAGSVVLDEVGFSQMDPAFLAVSGAG
jgi:hypothetical protein